MHFNPAFGGVENEFYEEVYKKKGGEGKQAQFYCTTKLDEIGNKDKLLKICNEKSFTWRDPRIIDDIVVRNA